LDIRFSCSSMCLSHISVPFSQFWWFLPANSTHC
jgi:hypothetical protein